MFDQDDDDEKVVEGMVTAGSLASLPQSDTDSMVHSPSTNSLQALPSPSADAQGAQGDGLTTGDKDTKAESRTGLTNGDLETNIERLTAEDGATSTIITIANQEVPLNVTKSKTFCLSNVVLDTSPRH